MLFGQCEDGEGVHTSMALLFMIEGFFIIISILHLYSHLHVYLYLHLHLIFVLSLTPGICALIGRHTHLIWYNMDPDYERRLMNSLMLLVNYC